MPTSEEHPFLVCPYHHKSLKSLSGNAGLLCPACAIVFPHIQNLEGFEFTSFAALLDVKHIGSRGGSIRTRYFGNFEGVQPGLAELVRNKAQFEGVSEVEWLEKCLRNRLNA